MPDSDPDPDPVHVARNATVTDAFVDWKLNYANPPALVAFLDDTIPKATWEPVSGDPDESRWIVENGFGLFKGFSDGPQQPPADTSPRTATWELEHTDGGTVERVPMYQHEVKNAQNRREQASVLSVTYKRGSNGMSGDLATRVSVAQDIVDRYLNGPLGSAGTSYWKHYHTENSNWPRARQDREDYDEYDDADVVLVADDIYTWHPARRQDLAADAEVEVYGDG